MRLGGRNIGRTWGLEKGNMVSLFTFIKIFKNKEFELKIKIILSQDFSTHCTIFRSHYCICFP